MSHDTPGCNGIASDETLLQIVHSLKKSDGARITELADEIDVSKSTIHRHLSTLRDNQYIVKEGHVYYLGLRFLDLGGYVRNRHEEYPTIQPKIRQLAEDTSEIAQFVTEEHGRGIFVYREAGENAVSTEARTGKHVYLHRNAAGKAILAGMSESERESTFERWGLPPKTGQTITDREALIEEIATIQDRQFAIDRGEHIEQLWAVGVSVTDPDDELIGAISVAGPRHRMKGEWFDEALPNQLLGVVNELELNLTYSR